MKRLYNAAASARSALFCQSRTAANSARHMDPVVRDALAETVQHDAAAVAQQLSEIDRELLRAAATLRDFEQKEQFLGVRTRQYRKALDARARELKQQQQQQQQAQAQEEASQRREQQPGRRRASGYRCVGQLRTAPGTMGEGHRGAGENRGDAHANSGPVRADAEKHATVGTAQTGCRPHERPVSGFLGGGGTAVQRIMVWK